MSDALRAAAEQPQSDAMAADSAEALLLPVHQHLQEALRIPTKPWPDAAAHGHEATGRAIHSAYCALRFKVMDALAALTAARCGLTAAPPPPAAAPSDQWTLVAPDGRRFHADTALKTVKAEIDSRLTPSQQLANIRASMADDEPAAAPAEQPQPSAPSGWIACDERMPEAGVEVLVWLAAPAFKGSSNVVMDTWDEQHEAPVAWSSATIPVGMGWDSGTDWERITHWMPLPAAPGVAPPPPAAAPCPHIRSSGTGEWATNWCALNGPPAAAPIEVTDAMVEAARAELASVSLGEYAGSFAPTEGEMRAAIDAALAAREGR